MYANTILEKTPEGKAALKKRELSDQERDLLRLVDGKSTMAQLIARHGDRHPMNFLAVADSLQARGFVVGTASVDPSPILSADHNPAIENEETRRWPEAQRMASVLREKGFYTYMNRDPLPPGEAPSVALKVMVVEDDDDLAQLMTLLLREKGFAVTHAGDAPDAVQLLKDGYVPDIILLDVILPTRDGFHVLKHIRRYTTLYDVPVIVVTSQVQEEDLLRGLKEGADGYIFKPFQWEALYACIYDAVGV